MIHQKKNKGHWTSKIVKSRQSYSNGHLPYQCFILLLSTRAWCMTWRVNLCAQIGSAETIKANVLKYNFLNWLILHLFTYLKAISENRVNFPLTVRGLKRIQNLPLTLRALISAGTSWLVFSASLFCLLFVLQTIKICNQGKKMESGDEYSYLNVSLCWSFLYP